MLKTDDFKTSNILKSKCKVERKTISFKARKNRYGKMIVVLVL